MPIFITIGYGDEAGYRQLRDDHKRAAHARDDELSASGALVGRAGDPVQVRNPDGAGVRIDPGPFQRSTMPIAGFSVIDAEDLDTAIERVSRTPCAVAHGVVEVWPLQA